MEITQELELHRKWTFRAHNRKMVFIKRPFESEIHVFTKAFIWSLFLPDYPDLAVEIHIGKRYKPDLVQLDGAGKPIFWGEAGQVRLRKMRDLVRRFKTTHLVFAKWDKNLKPFGNAIKKEAVSIRRSAPVDLISFPSESAERFIRRDGTIQISFKDVNRIRY